MLPTIPSHSPKCAEVPPTVGEAWLLLNAMRVFEYLSSDPAYHDVLLTHWGPVLVDVLGADPSQYASRWCGGMMYGWMDGWVGGWLGRWVDGWVGGWGVVRVGV